MEITILTHSLDQPLWTTYDTISSHATFASSIRSLQSEGLSIASSSSHFQKKVRRAFSARKDTEFKSGLRADGSCAVSHTRHTRHPTPHHHITEHRPHLPTTPRPRPTTHHARHGCMLCDKTNRYYDTNQQARRN